MKVKVRDYDTKKDACITMRKLQNLQFCNSPRLPQRILLRGEALEWTGIGWIKITPNGTEITVVNDNGAVL